MSGMIRYFNVPLGLTVAGVLAGAALGWMQGHTTAAALSVAFVCAVLAILEVSLSLDNAIVNARILKDMEPRWQRRFLTWGIVVAVLGMRVVFPVAIVAIASRIGPFQALHLAIANPNEYARVLSGAHDSISAFGGSFLLMVAFHYFIDSDKAVHWVVPVERGFSRLASVEGVQIGIVLALIVGTSYLLPVNESWTFLRSAVYGLLAFLVVEGLGNLVQEPEEGINLAVKAGAASLLYLEVLDASFSFDGVIGAFALSKDIFVIAIGLGIGASYVRAMTLLLVDKGTLAEYRYLEHGAFYAILVLALIMYAQTFMNVPEVVTGLIGAALIGTALLSSIVYAKSHPDAVAEAEASDPAAQALRRV